MLLCIFKNKFLFTTPVSALAQQGNEGHAETPSFKCQRHLHACATESLSSSFFFCRLVAGGLMVFPAVPLFEADDDTNNSKNNYMLCCVILLQLDLK